MENSISEISFYDCETGISSGCHVASGHLANYFKSHYIYEIEYSLL